MKRHGSLVALLTLLAGSAWAQGPAPAPAPAPRPAPAPAAPLPPVAPAPVAAPRASRDLELALRDQAMRLKDQALALRDRDIRLSDDARLEMERSVAEVTAQARLIAEDAQRQAQLAMQDGLFQLQTGPVIVKTPGDIRTTSAGDAYNTGLNALSQRQYDRAITAFDRVIASKAARADAALYWKSYAQYKLGKTDESVASIAQLRKDYPQSAYLSDAKVLETDVRRRAGQPINPATMDDDELKLLAIQGLPRTQESVPLLETILGSTNSLALKKKAVYLLALIPDARAHQLLLRYAKGAGNPDLQIESIRYLASRDDQQQTSAAELRDIYESSSDVNVKLAVIEAYRSTSNKPALVLLAGTGSAPAEVRARAVTSLNGLASADEVLALYQKETDRTLRGQMLSLLGSMRASDALAQLVRTEKDTTLRQRAIRALAGNRSDASKSLLIDLYGSEQDKDIKKSIISTIADQGNAEGLVALARKETTIELKTEIVRRLADMARDQKNKAATDYLMETLK